MNDVIISLEDEFGKVVLTDRMLSSGCTWRELLDSFFGVLRAKGYVIPMNIQEGIVDQSTFPYDLLEFVREYDRIMDSDDEDLIEIEELKKSLLSKYSDM